MTFYTIKAKINGQAQNLWSGYSLNEARRISSNHDKTVAFGGDVSWIWNNMEDSIVL